MDYIQKYGERFDYFDRCLGQPDWSKISILDFGGNWGNLLRDPKSKIPPVNYSCIDVSKKALELGKRDFPEANWHHYNRWNPRFNPQGQKGAKIPNLRSFDLIIACSVFTHTTENDMLDIISTLRQHCKKFAFTIMTPDVAAHYAKKRNSKYDEQELKNKTDGLKSFYLIDDDQVFTEDPKLDEARSFYYILTESHLQDLLPDALVYPPVGKEIQHCCVIDGKLA